MGSGSGPGTPASELFEKTVNGPWPIGRVRAALVGVRQSLIAYDPSSSRRAQPSWASGWSPWTSYWRESDRHHRCTCRRPGRRSVSSATKRCKVKASTVHYRERRPRRHRRRDSPLRGLGRPAGRGAGWTSLRQGAPAPTPAVRPLENVVATPHLGASTDEAQEKAGIAVAKSVRQALTPVNSCRTPSNVRVAPSPNPCVHTCHWSRSCRLATALAPRADRQGQRGRCPVNSQARCQRPPNFAAVRGCSALLVDEPVSWLQRPVLAADRGVVSSWPPRRFEGTFADGASACRVQTAPHCGIASTVTGLHDDEAGPRSRGPNWTCRSEHLLVFRHLTDRRRGRCRRRASWAMQASTCQRHAGQQGERRRGCHDGAQRRLHSGTT